MNQFDQEKVSPTPIKQVVRTLQSSGYDNFSLPKCDWAKKKKKKKNTSIFIKEIACNKYNPTEGEEE